MISLMKQLFCNGTVTNKIISYPRLRHISTTPLRLLKPNVLFIRPADDEPTITPTQMMEYFDVRTDYQTKTPEEIKAAREAPYPFLPQTADDLPQRKMKDSFVCAVIPLESDITLRDRYLSHTGLLRHGRLLEDVDIFAVYSAYQHIHLPKLPAEIKFPYSVVTGCVDSIHVSRRDIKSDRNIRMSAHVSYAGKTSMEVCVSLDQVQKDGKIKTVFEAIFVVLARKLLGDGGGLVNRLVGETPEEKAYLKEAEERASLRKFAEMNSLSRLPPNKEERELIHNTFLRRMPDGSKMDAEFFKNVLPMQKTALNTLFLCHPEYRNFAHKIFGGFIMQKAYELAWTNTYIFAKQRPQISAIDDIIFVRPVEIGSLLRFRSVVGYVEGNYINTPVFAEIIDPLTGESVESNLFNFTFSVKNAEKLPLVIFETYREAMLYLNARRHMTKMLKQKTNLNKT